MLAIFAILLTGCGSGDKLAKAGGVVTYRGKPIAGANVIFIPEAGAPAIASTDEGGAFSWTTQGSPGALIGAGKVAITATEKYEFKSEEQMTSKDIQKMGRSIIPVKYGRAETSGLAVTVNADGNNNFQLELKD
ncbi:MAG TPA: hypothetical protein VM260_14170 [Pirellula sp.]|nr:hypothetical protein [Pirellula sp.]